MSAARDIVVVGANVAGVQAAESLRTFGFEGPLTLIDADPDAPYNRPPLSKEYLLGDLDDQDIELLSATELATLGINLLPGVQARGLDAGRRVITTSIGDMPYDKLLVATGSCAVVPRPWADIPGVVTLRTLDDARRIREIMQTRSPPVVVVGGGLIGCEVAATARQLGLDVTIVEAGPDLMIRVLPRGLSEPLTRAHTEHGVHVLCDAAVRELIGMQDGSVVVVLVDGRTIDAELVVVGVGALPNTAWLADSGLELRNGIVTDVSLQAHLDVFAAGDVARVATAEDPAGSRVEHWTNARRHGHVAAASMLDLPPAHEPNTLMNSYIWSDQYGVRLQVAGTTAGDELHVLRKWPATDHYLTVVGRSGQVVGAVGYGAQGFAKARKWVAAGASWDVVISSTSEGIE